MRFAVPFVLAIHVAAATVPLSVEKPLRARADQFYKLIVAKQFRQSEAFVSRGDRDTYYAMEKPLISDYMIKKVTLADHGKTATLEMESTTRVRRAMIGDIAIPLSYLSHWKLENGTWFWYIPSLETRQTPFGPMTFSKQGLGQENDETIKKKLAQAPSPEQVLTGVKVDVNTVALGEKPGDMAIVNFKNTLPGRVKLIVGEFKTPVLSLRLWPQELGSGDHATLMVKRTAAGKFDPTNIVFKVDPTQQQIVIQVR